MHVGSPNKMLVAYSPGSSFCTSMDGTLGEKQEMLQFTLSLSLSLAPYFSLFLPLSRSLSSNTLSRLTNSNGINKVNRGIQEVNKKCGSRGEREECTRGREGGKKKKRVKGKEGEERSERERERKGECLQGEFPSSIGRCRIQRCVHRGNPSLGDYPLEENSTTLHFQRTEFDQSTNLPLHFLQHISFSFRFIFSKNYIRFASRKFNDNLNFWEK